MSTFMLFAQNVTFEAILLEEETNEPLIGATVLFEETGQGNVSDIEGKVIIENVPEGEHEINISFLGFQTIDTILNISLIIHLSLSICMKQMKIWRKL